MQFKNKSWVEISRENLNSNYAKIQKIVGEDITIVAVVKANAYGHGLIEVVSILYPKVKFFAVDNANEALTIRKLCPKAHILVLGFIPDAYLKSVIDNEISFSVFNKENFYHLVKIKSKKQARIHLKIETGLNRLGFKEKELNSLLHNIIVYKNKIKIEGVYTHLADVEDTENPGFTNQQIKKFNKSLKLIEHFGLHPRYIHTSSTGAAMIYPRFRFNTIRIGIGLYGLWPSDRNRKIIQKKYNLNFNPALSWKSIVASINFINKGETVSYGRTWKATKHSTIAVIPIGYSDGYPRNLSNKGKVLIHGKIANVVGRVAMNMFMVDITSIKGVKRGDEVSLINKDISADNIAQKIDTINYEIVCRINPNLPRIII